MLSCIRSPNRNVMFFTKVLVRGGVCPDRRALWHESEYGEDIPVPHEEKLQKYLEQQGIVL